MEIKTRDDLALILSLCDQCVKLNGLNTSPRVYKLAQDCNDAMKDLPDVPTPLSPEAVEEVEKAKKLKRLNDKTEKTLDEMNSKRL